MKTMNMVALILLIIGGLNWGLVGMFNFDLVSTLFGVGTTASKVVYSLVGISALYNLLFWQHIRCRCTSHCQK